MDDDDIVRDDMVMSIDLNLDPGGSSELDAAHNGIEDRIRRLEEVTSRARESQRLQQLQISVPERSREMGNESEVRDGNRVDARERTAERGKGCKRDHSVLVAKALEMDSDVKKDVDDGGSFYDCNICLEVAKDPVLTCCGHLFCWACFYRVDYVDLTAKECPVCRGDVVDSDITPIYGSSKDRRMSESGGGVSIPPRPRAHRIESLRQQRVNIPMSSVPVSEAVRRIRIELGLTRERRFDQEDNNATPEQPREQNLDRTTDGSLTDWQPRLIAEIGGSRRDNTNVEQPRRQTLDTTTPGTPANIEQVWRRITRETVTDWAQRSRNVEIGGSGHDNDTPVVLGRLDRRTGRPVIDWAQIARNAERGASGHDIDTPVVLGQLDPRTGQPVIDWAQRSRNAEIGRSQRDHANFYLQRQDGTTVSTPADFRRVWSTESGGSAHDNDTTEHRRQGNLDPTTGISLTDSQQRSTNEEIGDSHRDNATPEQPRRQAHDGRSAESLTNLQRLWMTAEHQGIRYNSATSEQPRQQNLGSVTAGSLTDSMPLWTTSEIGSSRRTRSHQLSRVLSETAASLSSISFALNNVERLVENLESYIRELTMQRTDSQLMGANDMDTLGNTVAVTQTELQTLTSTSETNLAFSVPSASGTPDASAAVAPLENLEAGIVVSDDLATLDPPPSRRRSFASRVADLENEFSQESQRRRMR